MNARADTKTHQTHNLNKKRFKIELSPINKRRWSNFKANKVGYFSLWLFMSVFIITLFAEFIANDKPLLVKYDGALYMPVFKTYTEKTFGGDVELIADYRQQHVQDFIKAKEGWVIWPIVPFGPHSINRNPSSQPFPLPPSSENWLGTDDQGRDVLARIIYGTRISITFGLILTIVSSIIGVIAGAVQGYFGGRVDLISQRFIELWTSLPQLFILMIFATILAPGFWMLLGILLLFSWTGLVGLVRAEFLRGRNFDYIRAAKSLGVSDTKIIFKHLLPNAMVATITFLPFILTSSVMTLTSLDFLGLGLPVGTPSFGELMLQANANRNSLWLVLSAFISSTLMLSLLVFIGEAVRDALDPRKTFK